MINDLTNICKIAAESIINKEGEPCNSSNLVLLEDSKLTAKDILLARLGDKIDFIRLLRKHGCRSDQSLGNIIGEALADVLGYFIKMRYPSNNIVETEWPCTELKGHKGTVDFVKYSPSGRFMVSFSEADRLILWDLSTGKRVKNVGKDITRVGAAAFSPNGDFLMVAYHDDPDRSGDIDKGVIKIFNVMTGACMCTITGVYSWINTIGWSVDSNFIAFNGLDDTVEIWSISSESLVRSLDENSSFVTALSYSPNGELLASADAGGFVCIWDAATGEYIHTVKCGIDHLYSVAWSPDSKFLAFGGSSGDINIWEVKTRDIVKSFEPHINIVNSISYSPDGKFLVSSSMDSTVRIWDLERDVCVKTFTQGKYGLASVAWSPDGKHIACGGWGKTVSILDVDINNE